MNDINTPITVSKDNSKWDSLHFNKPSGKIVLVAGVLSIIVLSVFFCLYQYKNLFINTQIATNTATTTPIFIPKKISFGANTPTDFPTNIPLEKGAIFSQSNSLDYNSQKQLTVVFLSNKTVKDNYSLYLGFLKSDNWSLPGKNEGLNVSSLYGTKGNYEI